MRTNNDILLGIIKKIASIEKPTDEVISKLLVRNPSVEGTPFLKSDIISAYKKFVKKGTLKATPLDEKRILEILKTKRVRTLSGVAPVTVLTKPFPCPESVFTALTTSKCLKATFLPNPAPREHFLINLTLIYRFTTGLLLIET